MHFQSCYHCQQHLQMNHHHNEQKLLKKKYFELLCAGLTFLKEQKQEIKNLKKQHELQLAALQTDLVEEFFLQNKFSVDYVVPMTCKITGVICWCGKTV